MSEEQLNQSRLAKLERLDKRKSAFHEAGHVTVASAKGLRAWAWLYRSDTLRPFDEKIWRGRTQIVGDDPVYAVAGMVAEQLMYQDDIPLREIMEQWKLMGDTEVGLSPTDMELVPRDWPAREAVVEEALTILRDRSSCFAR
jgi:hypothetical protein